MNAAARRGDKVPNHIVAAFNESDLGAHLAYYLSKHEKEASRIYSMTPAKALLALGKIEDTLVKKPKEVELKEPAPPSKADTKPQVTRAPAPMPSLSGSADIQPDLSKMNFSEYKRHRLEQRKR